MSFFRLWWWSVEAWGGSKHLLFTCLPSQQCSPPRWTRWGNFRLQLLQLLVGRTSRLEQNWPRLYIEGGHMYKIDWRLPGQELGSGAPHSNRSQGVPCIWVSEHGRPLEDLAGGWAGWHKGQTCSLAQLHLRWAGGDPVPQVRAGRLLGDSRGWAPILCCHSCNK